MYLVPLTLYGAHYAEQFNCADARASKLAPVTTTVPKVRSMLDYMDYGVYLYHRPPDIPDIHYQSADLHLARFAFVSAPKSTGHSCPGLSSL